MYSLPDASSRLNLPFVRDLAIVSSSRLVVDYWDAEAAKERNGPHTDTKCTVKSVFLELRVQRLKCVSGAYGYCCD